MKKFTRFLIIFFSICAVSFTLLLNTDQFYIYLSKVEHVGPNVAHKFTNNDKVKNILIVHLEENYGGAEICNANMYKMFLKNGYNSYMLTSRGFGVAHECDRLKLPYYVSNAEKFLRFRFIYKRVLAAQIYSLCKRFKKCTIIVHSEREVFAAKLVAKRLPIKVILGRHVTCPFAHERRTLSGLDGVIAVSKYIEKDLRALVDKYQLPLKHIDVIQPFFDEDKFFNFKPTDTKKVFFKKEFNINLKDLPVITMIGSMPHWQGPKRHDILLNVVARLVHEKNKPVEVILVGDGNGKKALKELSEKLNISEYVHFLGFTDITPAILYHSHIKVLPSEREAFGIVLLEGALMKKPLIYSTGNGGDELVLHEKTGLLFENKNEDDLLKQIERMLDDPEWAKQLGENAYKHARENFSSEIGFEKVIKLCNKVNENT